MGGNATLVKKLGGRQATMLHGYMMFAGTCVALFGWYVIYSNKEAMGKAHNTTWHGFLGSLFLLLTLIMSVLSFVALDPDWGMAKTKTIVRKIHKNSGRAVIAFALAVSVLGWNTNQGGKIPNLVLFTAPLPIFMLVLR